MSKDLDSEALSPENYVPELGDILMDQLQRPSETSSVHKTDPLDTPMYDPEPAPVQQPEPSRRPRKSEPAEDSKMP